VAEEQLVERKSCRTNCRSCHRTLKHRRPELLPELARSPQPNVAELQAPPLLLTGSVGAPRELPEAQELS